MQPDLDALQMDQIDLLDTKLTHLAALLAVIHGNGAESFHQYADHVQDDYIFACYTLVEECREALRKLFEQGYTAPTQSTCPNA